MGLGKAVIRVFVPDPGRIRRQSVADGQDGGVCLLYTSKAVVTAPTCDTMGYTTHTCATCGRSYVDSYTAATDHDYKSEVTKEATCTAEGVLTFTCQHEGCGKTYTQAIPKADHAMTATVTKPTCLSFGYTEYRCQHCDYSYVNAFTQPTGHAWNDGEVTVQPTIWETGTMTYTLSLIHI